MGNNNSSVAEQEVNAQSVSLLLSTTLSEYSSEHERTATLDSKAGIALPILATYFLAFAQMNNYKSIIAIPRDDFFSSLLPIAIFLSYTAGLLLSATSAAFMAKVLFVKDYCRINPLDLYNEEYLLQPYNDFSIKLMHLYFKAVEFNRKVNNERARLYQRSWLLTFISVICFVVYIMINSNI